ncbi:alpha-amylase family glycosyl hydrolase [Candidatus Oscillochloris fontis]|uniref:alpha-amylase family glycosyl hydrolase n=1 Tax=Candidatus Oscillochloris fontis TaxID=2496868 RepID=UPI00101CF1B4|nr:alpha-amylase family glycosyl hydrolase [Candidatus Oscillochloris fontis]
MNHWSQDAIFYHIYPLGLCGAPKQNDFHCPPTPRLQELHGWIAHLRDLGVNALYLGPVFESSAHGYDTADFYQVDRRLGQNQDLADLAAALHQAGIRLILDGVFNHVGRDFWAFRDLRANGAASAFRDWFAGVDFSQSSPYGDPFTYTPWNGHFDLVKLNLQHPDVRAHLFEAVRSWFATFQIDGLRLDVAEQIDPAFLRDLAALCRSMRPDAWLLGEQVHGDYRRLTDGANLDSATNYELYKGLFSSLNDANYFEVAYALNRQFGMGGMYRNLPLYNFADNHDVARVASLLRQPRHLAPLYALLLTAPGVPSIYYGSEWGLGGVKAHDDWPLRPRLELATTQAHAPHPHLPALITHLIAVRHATPALRYGDYQQLHVAAEQLAFVRRWEHQRALVALNAATTPHHLHLRVDLPDGTRLHDALNPEQVVVVAGGKIAVGVPANWACVWVNSHISTT